MQVLVIYIIEMKKFKRDNLTLWALPFKLLHGVHASTPVVKWLGPLAAWGTVHTAWGADC